MGGWRRMREKGRGHSRGFSPQIAANGSCLASWSEWLLPTRQIGADSGDESKLCSPSFVVVWAVFAHPVICAESQIIFLHPSPINLAANGKSPWTWAYDDLFSLVSNSSASLCAVLGTCMVFWRLVGEGLQCKPNFC